MAGEALESLFERYARAVIPHLKVWASTDGLKNLDHIRPELFENGIHWKIERLPDYAALAWDKERQDLLKSLPEAAECAEAHWSAGKLDMPAIHDEHQRRIDHPPWEQARELAVDEMVSIVVDALQRSRSLRPTR